MFLWQRNQEQEKYNRTNVFNPPKQDNSQSWWKLDFLQKSKTHFNNNTMSNPNKLDNKPSSFFSPSLSNNKWQGKLQSNINKNEKLKKYAIVFLAGILAKPIVKLLCSCKK